MTHTIQFAIEILRLCIGNTLIFQRTSSLPDANRAKRDGSQLAGAYWQTIYHSAVMMLYLYEAHLQEAAVMRRVLNRFAYWRAQTNTHTHTHNYTYGHMKCSCVAEARATLMLKFSVLTFQSHEAQSDHFTDAVVHNTNKRTNSWSHKLVSCCLFSGTIDDRGCGVCFYQKRIAK